MKLYLLNMLLLLILEDVMDHEAEALSILNHVLNFLLVFYLFFYSFVSIKSGKSCT